MRIWFHIAFLAVFLSVASSARAFVVESHEPLKCAVVLDPGHGGGDTGAIGPSGFEEKTVVLSIALKALPMVEEKTKCRVFLTRTGDVFVPLEERTNMANRLGADVFLSIHVNSALRKSASGVETFFLSFDSTDEDARRLAAFENSSSVGPDGAQDRDDLKDIMLDLVQTAAHHLSSTLAGRIHESAAISAKGGDRGVKQAPFVVLIGALMPAALVEVGFISNPDEEKRLVSAEWQDKIASSIAEGVAKYHKGAFNNARFSRKKP